MISSSSQMQISNAKAPIAVIVKSPCLAIRYPTRVNQVRPSSHINKRRRDPMLTHWQIRRFQLKFASSADYCRAISILSEIGCPITESIVGTTCQTSVGSQTRPNTSAWSQDTSTPLRTSTSHIENQNGRAAPVLVSETRPSTMVSILLEWSFSRIVYVAKPLKQSLFAFTNWLTTRLGIVFYIVHRSSF